MGKKKHPRVADVFRVKGDYKKLNAFYINGIHSFSTLLEAELYPVVFLDLVDQATLVYKSFGV
jgi:hypothetical protein